MSFKKYDGVIVGAGPAGIFTALELAKSNQKILLLDKGKSLEGRIKQGVRDAGSGWGGSGAYSDGKLNISTTAIGVRITDYMKEEDFVRLVLRADQIWVEYGAPKKLYGTDQRKIAMIEKSLKKTGLEIKVSPIRHIGTGRTFEVLGKMYDYLAQKMEIKFETEVEEILVDEQKKVRGVRVKGGKEILASWVVMAPGRCGSGWFTGEVEKMGLKKIVHPVEIGVRVEVPAKVMKKVTDVLYEAKISYRTKTFDDFVRTFCMCPNGFVTDEVVGINGHPVISVNGHTFSDRKSNNTNFALLVKNSFTQPFNQPNLYGAYVTGLANLLSGGVLVQRLGDLLAGRRSTAERIKSGQVKPSLNTAVPGDLAFSLPYRHLSNLLEMLKEMDKLAPGIFSFDTLLYGNEVKFFSAGPSLSPCLETEIKNLFACGDGAGVSANLLHAAVTGLKVGEEINKRFYEKYLET
ncbi:MAG: FAD-dependent protein [Patescibacteria group bacterium]